MADTLMMWDGGIRTVFSMDDFIQLVDEYMGMDARQWLEAGLSSSEGIWAYAEELEKDLERQKKHHREVMMELRSLSEKEAGLIEEKKIERHELSNIAGKIGVITWREINS